jgi:Rrf2 family transcriptional regulator, cysteine metabolism repressor
MKISNRTFYGLKLMLRLAIAYNENVLSLNEIAESENISEKFLENIISAIKAKGIVKVKRGAKGGYFLAKAPSEITLNEIFDALEADILNQEWDKHDEITTADSVIKKYLWEFQTEIGEILKNKTLEELKIKYEKLKPDTMFYI